MELAERQLGLMHAVTAELFLSFSLILRSFTFLHFAKEDAGLILGIKLKAATPLPTLTISIFRNSCSLMYLMLLIILVASGDIVSFLLVFYISFRLM